MKISEICNGPFSAVSTNFWNFSSKSVRSRRAVPKMLFKFFFSNFFSRSKFDDKVGIFGLCGKFLNFFSSNFCKFKGSGSRFGLILTDREERIQKFVDTAEKWLVENREILGHFPLLKTRRTCRRSFAAIWAARTPTKVPFSTAWRVVLGPFFLFCVGDVWRAETWFERCSDFLPFFVSLKEFEFSKARGDGSAR